MSTGTPALSILSLCLYNCEKGKTLSDGDTDEKQTTFVPALTTVLVTTSTLNSQCLAIRTFSTKQCQFQVVVGGFENIKNVLADTK
jgi:hypothetical protein